MNKDRKISIEKYSAWFLCNVIICLVPIGIILVIGKINENLDLVVVFSSILAFLFTLFIISIYHFFPSIMLNRESIGEEFLFFVSLLVTVLVTILFVLYNVMTGLQQYVNDNMYYWILLLLPLILAIALNHSAIDKRISDKRAAARAAAVASAFERGGKRREAWIETIRGGGAGENK